MQALIYGGSRSGKSALAETMLLSTAGADTPLIYIATMHPGDEESHGRIARHQADRAHKGFTTIECPAGLEKLTIPPASGILLECLGTLTANEMFHPDGSGDGATEAILRGLEKLSLTASRLLVVSNDVFADGVEYAESTKSYLRTLSRLNRHLAARSAVVAEVVCGIPLWHFYDEAWDR